MISKIHLSDRTPFSSQPFFRKADWGLYNFVLDCSDAELARYLCIGPEEWVMVFCKGDLNWCLQAYLILAERGKLSIQCSNRLHNDCINIIHSDQLLKLRGTAGQFIVCVRADYPRRQWAHFHLVQNHRQLSANRAYIPHWVQPGLIGRDAARSGVSRVAYAGAPIRGNMAGDEASWKRLFEPHGIEFVVLPSGRWHDLSQVDVLLGIRSFNSRKYHAKPPTKLFNAWHAKIPFVGGYDSAFSQVASPGKEYLRVRSPKEAVAAVLGLRDNPDLYDAMVKRGLLKAQQYSKQKIAEQWEKVLSEQVLQRYEDWVRRPAYEEIRFNALQKVGLLEHRGKQWVKKLLKGSKSMQDLWRFF